MRGTMSRAPITARSILSLALASSGCTAPGLYNLTTHDAPPDDDASTSPATTEEPSPPTGDPPTTTGPDSSSTSSTGPDTTSTTDTSSSSTSAPALPPSILDIAFVPDPLHASGLIKVTVTTDDADDVTMQVD